MSQFLRVFSCYGDRWLGLVGGINTPPGVQKLNQLVLSNENLGVKVSAH